MRGKLFYLGVSGANFMTGFATTVVVGVVVTVASFISVVVDPLCTRRFKISSEPHAVIKPAIKISNSVAFPGITKTG